MPKIPDSVKKKLEGRCKACRGTGKASRGSQCFPCKGTGKVLPPANKWLDDRQ